MSWYASKSRSELDRLDPNSKACFSVYAYVAGACGKLALCCIQPRGELRTNRISTAPFVLGTWHLLFALLLFAVEPR